MLYKRLPQFTKEISGNVVTGIAAVHGNIDSWGDRSLNGSFSNWINGSGRKRAKFLWNHDSFTPPTASIKNVREVDRGELPTKVTEYAPDATGGVEVTREYYPKDVSDLAAWILHGIQAGDIDEMSYAYDIKDSDMVTENEERIHQLKILEIFDFSDVQWGMNPATAGVKGGQQRRKGEQLAAFLNRTIDAMVSDDMPRSEILEAMAGAADITVDTLRQILSGEIIRPPDERLRGFADVLNVSFERLQSLADDDAKGLLPDGLRFADSAGVARVAVVAFSQRVEAIKQLREKKGRGLSKANRLLVQDLIESISGELESLKSQLVTPTQAADNAAVLDALAAWQRTQARLNGVRI